MTTDQTKQSLHLGEQLLGWVVLGVCIVLGTSAYQCACTPPATYEECAREADDDLWRCREWGMSPDTYCDSEWRRSRALCREWLGEGDTE